MADTTITLPAAVWQSVEKALADYLRFGPGDIGDEYIPDEHLERALRAIRKRQAVTPGIPMRNMRDFDKL